MLRGSELAATNLNLHLNQASVYRIRTGHYFGIAEIESLMKQVQRLAAMRRKHSVCADNRLSEYSPQSLALEGLPGLPARGKRVASAHLRGVRWRS